MIKSKFLRKETLFGTMGQIAANVTEPGHLHIVTHHLAIGAEPVDEIEHCVE
jgi:hypothetical protein